MNYPQPWQAEGDYLVATWQLADFMSALAFVNQVAVLAEKFDHHPDMEIFAYRQVKLKLTTHETGNQITAKDLELAEKISQLLA